MKKIIFLSMAILPWLSCKQEEKKGASMSGAYQLTQMSYKGGGIDTTIQGSQQVKIYSPTHYMFASLGADSSVGFGFGAYDQEGDVITEHNTYRPGYLDSAMSVRVEVKRTDNGYEQHIPELMVSGVSYAMDEKYTQLPAGTSSVLDGAWEQVKSITVKGTDTVTASVKQFKMYQGGYFLFVHQYSDSAQKAHSGFGFGTFTVSGNTVTEKNSLSNYKALVGMPISVAFQMDGDDAYSQSITDTTNHSVTTEYYKRVK